jgi:transposase
VLSEQDRKTLESTARASTSSARDIFHARIVLLAAEGLRSDAIAERLHTREATVSQWRRWFGAEGMAGLLDRPRAGHKPLYTPDTERRILAKLDEKPPQGYATWNGRLIAEAPASPRPSKCARPSRPSRGPTTRPPVLSNGPSAKWGRKRPEILTGISASEY